MMSELPCLTTKPLGGSGGEQKGGERGVEQKRATLAVFACPPPPSTCQIAPGEHLLRHAISVGVRIRMCLLAGGQETQANPDSFSFSRS